MIPNTSDFVRPCFGARQTLFFLHSVGFSYFFRGYDIFAPRRRDSFFYWLRVGRLLAAMCRWRRGGRLLAPTHRRLGGNLVWGGKHVVHGAQRSPLAIARRDSPDC